MTNQAAAVRKQIIAAMPDVIVDDDPQLQSCLDTARSMAISKAGIPFGSACVGFADNTVLVIAYRRRIVHIHEPGEPTRVERHYYVRPVAHQL